MFSTESKVAPATVSSWESLTNPKTPTSSRLSAYARFFATRRSLDPETLDLLLEAPELFARIITEESEGRPPETVEIPMPPG